MSLLQDFFILPPYKITSMKFLKLFALGICLSVFIFSCRNDQEDFGVMRGINYFSRHDAMPVQELVFDNSSGDLNDSLNKGSIISIGANCFVNEDGSAFSGKVYLTIKEALCRGHMALNSLPTVNDLQPMTSEGSVYIHATDVQGHELKIAAGKYIEVAIPGPVNATQNKMYYGDDNVSDPSIANSVLFNWHEASTDTVEYYWDIPASTFYYKMKPSELGWITCARNITVNNPVGLKVRVRGVNPISHNNTAVYAVPVSGKSVFRLWNYDKPTNTFSLDQPYLSKGTGVRIVAISYGRHGISYYGRADYTMGDNSEFVDSSEITSAGTMRLYLNNL